MFFLQIIVPDNFSANCRSGQLFCKLWHFMCFFYWTIFCKFCKLWFGKLLLQIIQISVRDSLFANFVNCRCVLDILFLRVVQLVVLDILFTNSYELLFQSISFCKKVLDLIDWVDSFSKGVRVGEVVKVVRELKKVDMSHLWQTDMHTSESWALFCFWAEFAIANTWHW